MLGLLHKATNNSAVKSPPSVRTSIDGTSTTVKSDCCGAAAAGGDANRTVVTAATSVIVVRSERLICLFLLPSPVDRPRIRRSGRDSVEVETSRRSLAASALILRWSTPLVQARHP